MTGIAPISNAVPPATNPISGGNFGVGSEATPPASHFSDVLTSVSPAFTRSAASAAGKRSYSQAPVSSATQKSSSAQASRSPLISQAASIAASPSNLSPTNPAAAHFAGAASTARPAADDVACSNPAPTALVTAGPLESVQPGLSAAITASPANSPQVADVIGEDATSAQLATADAASGSDASGIADTGLDGAAGLAMTTDASSTNSSQPESSAAAGAAVQARNELQGAASSGIDGGSAARAHSSQQSFSFPTLVADQLRGQSHNPGLSQRLRPEGETVSRTGDAPSPSRASYAAPLRGDGTASSADLQKAISDTRDKFVQEIEAHLQAELSAAPAKAIASAAPAAGVNGNPLGQNSGNAASNSSTQDAGNQSEARTSDMAGSHAANLGVIEASSANADCGGELKTISQVGPAADPSAHLAIDVSSQTTPAATTPSAPPQLASASGANATRPVPLPEALLQSLSDVVKASELYQRVGGSEMHIAMQTDLLGAVDLRATMHQSTLTATISVQRSDVQSLLANELPALQHILADKNFHVDQISVLNNSVGGRAGSSGQQPAQQQNSPASRSTGVHTFNGVSGISAEDSMAILASSSAYGGLGDGSGRISVHV